MTEAPMSANTMVAKGPANTLVRSNTLMPDRGPGGGKG